MEFRKWRWEGDKWNSRSGGGDSRSGIPKVEVVIPEVEFQKWKDDSEKWNSKNGEMIQKSGIPEFIGSGWKF